MIYKVFAVHGIGYFVDGARLFLFLVFFYDFFPVHLFPSLKAKFATYAIY
jgi:hypothetical protein